MSKRERQTDSINGVPQNKVSPSPLHTGTTKRRKLQFGKSANIAHSQNTSETLSMRKLDPAIPQESQRAQTRYKMLQKGKNTAGYDEYLKAIPKENRSKIAEHPTTPDHTLDIPNRRWQGQVKAWYV